MVTREACSNKAGLLLFVALLVVASHAQAAANVGVLDDVTHRFQSAAASWTATISDAAARLFWSLAVISMVWTFGMMALRKADIGEFFAEFARFTIFTGFYLWILTNGPSFAISIMDSLKQLGGQASGAAGITPSGIVDVGFNVFSKVVENSSMFSPAVSLGGILMGIIILGALALVAVNMVVLLVSGWILAYAGTFFLGFGGSRWTSDMAINYYKTVLGVAASLMGMVLLVGIGKGFIDDYYAQMGDATMKDLAVLLVASIVLLALVSKIPGLIAGIITGASVGGAAHAGSFGAGTLLGAGAIAGAAVAAAGAAVSAGTSQALGGSQALSAAFKAASQAGSSGSDFGASAMGMSAGSGAGGDGGAPSLGEAMGGSGGGSQSPMSDMGKAANGGGSSSQSERDAGSSDVKDGDFASAVEGEGGGSGAKEGDSSASEQGGSSALGQLARGVGRMARNKTVSAWNAAQQRGSETALGQLAQEIRSPTKEQLWIPSNEAADEGTPSSSPDTPTTASSSDEGSAEVAEFRDRKQAS
ncbi:conjugal transfer protein TrbL (plasmid) [Variovorax sp. SRS16]|uniref:P-type conjugative transfer protein TrbL n=1 Tax=Variovorax sp. SRS16 TaxID=282217 RepID=UPI0013173A44|nr:P-type conjugative transfer protein TrbL [Variovorax sp. SRS16]VTU46197.1 conjugal transfer protein TrbL [Variovorax sp. SRS16]